jgi:hypothetical protein
MGKTVTVDGKKLDHNSNKDILNNINYFMEKVLQYQKEFGLFNWEINIEEIDDDECRGEIQYDISARLAVIYYDQTWIRTVKLKKEEIALVAFHEMCELFLAEIHSFIVKHSDCDYADSLTHNVIRFMESKLLKKLG